MMELLALVTLLVVVQYFAFMLLCGAARAKSGIQAPAMLGDEMFERALRVQMNTLEQLAIVLPAIWLSGMFFRFDVASICGLIFIIGRFVYRASYMKEPAKRTTGMLIGFLAMVALLLTAFIGVVLSLF